MIKVYNAADVIEAVRIVLLLEENSIASYYQDSSSSVVGYGVSGFGLYGVDVYVDESDFKRAQDIIESITEAGKADDGIPNAKSE